jgi:ferric-dicitrate binding protein FerR (iron transport regulator)
MCRFPRLKQTQSNLKSHTAMGSDPQDDTYAPTSIEPPPTRGQILVPALAVLAVVVAALAAAVMSKRGDMPGEQMAAAPAARQEVVRAPPLKPQARTGTSAMGAAPACRTCGVVESVVASAGKGFQMRIRMDDGSLRTVEQRGALAAGTRVVVDGASVKLMPGPG